MGQYPWYTSLVGKGIKRCCGSLITPDFVLTTAHDLFVGISYGGLVIVGDYCDKYENPYKVFYVFNLFLHPENNYYYNPWYYDYGPIQFDHPATTIEPVAIDLLDISNQFTKGKKNWYRLWYTYT